MRVPYSLASGTNINKDYKSRCLIATRETIWIRLHLLFTSVLF